MIKLLGWRGSGKTSSIAMRAIKLAHNGKRVLILVPSASTIEIMKEYIPENLIASNKIDIKIFDAYYVHTFYDSILIDEVDQCLNRYFDNKVDCISLSYNDDYIFKGV